MQDKERLLEVKVNVTSRLHTLYQLAALQSTFDKGHSDVTKWLDEADKIISSYGIPSSAEAITVLQDKHKVFEIY